jgi:hypothetical protein
MERSLPAGEVTEKPTAFNHGFALVATMALGLEVDVQKRDSV